MLSYVIYVHRYYILIIYGYIVLSYVIFVYIYYLT